MSQAAEARGEDRGQELGEARGLRRAQVETAKWNFGAEAAEGLAEVLAGVTDRSRLTRLGRLLAECETGDEPNSPRRVATSEGRRRAMAEQHTSSHLS